MLGIMRVYQVAPPLSRMYNSCLVVFFSNSTPASRDTYVTAPYTARWNNWSSFYKGQTILFVVYKKIRAQVDDVKSDRCVAPRAPSKYYLWRV